MQELMVVSERIPSAAVDGVPRRSFRLSPFVAAAALVAVAGGSAVASDSQNPLDMGLIELMDVDLTVTSPARRAQRLGDVAAAVSVLTAEDLRRAGVSSIPDALRLVPGVQVSQIDSSKWSVTSRGFAGRFANKQQAMIDGRIIYSPLFSGVFWEQHDLVLEDIDRIEVIRGPAAALYGANAVNGTINIITKSAAETQGGLFSTLTDGRELIASTRYGAPVGTLGHARLSGKLRRADAGRRAGRDADDDLAFGRVDGRADLSVGDGDTLSLFADVYRGASGGTTGTVHLSAPLVRTGPGDLDYLGADLQGRWRRSFSERSQLTIQGYYQYVDFETRDNIGREVMFNGTANTVDLEVEYGFPIGDRQQIVVGGEYRHLTGSADPTRINTINRGKASNDIVSVFVQDEITLISAELDLTLASRIDQNSITGLEIQPTARLLWSPLPDLSLWGAASRAVRSPSLFEFVTERTFYNATRGPGGIPVAQVNARAHQPASEEVFALEAGIRSEPVRGLAVEVAAFYNQYDGLQSLSAEPPRLLLSPVRHLEAVQRNDNKLKGESYGLELSADWAVRPGWRLGGAYSFLMLDLWAAGGSQDQPFTRQEGYSPVHQGVVRSSFDLTPSVDLDWTLRVTDQLKALSVEGSVEIDARLAWRPMPGVEAALVGRNLLDHRRPEFIENFGTVQSTEVERQVLAALTVRL